MKRAFPVLLIILSGCIVQSFYPFCTDKSKVALPQLDGQWDAITAWGEDVATNVPPWQISGSQMTAYSKESQPSKIDVTFFKLGSQLFCDSAASSIGDMSVPLYWAWHVRPIHTVTKVETNADLLVLKPLDLDWLTNRLASGKISLSHLARPEDDNWPLFNCKPIDWEKFLTKYANNADAFPSNHIYVLKRHVATHSK